MKELKDIIILLLQMSKNNKFSEDVLRNSVKGVIIFLLFSGGFAYLVYNKAKEEVKIEVREEVREEVRIDEQISTNSKKFLEKEKEQEALEISIQKVILEKEILKKENDILRLDKKSIKKELGK